MSKELQLPQKKSELRPDRYYTPQVNNQPEKIHAQAYQPTPRPESVIINKKSVVPKNESCCLACLLACFLCLAVKGEDEKSSPPPPSSFTSLNSTKQ